MDHDHGDHHARAPVVQSTNQPPGCDLRNDVLQTVVCLAWRRGIIKREKNPGKSLYEKEKESDASKHLVPAARTGNLLVEKAADRGFQAGSMIKPIQNSS